MGYNCFSPGPPWMLHPWHDTLGKMKVTLRYVRRCLKSSGEASNGRGKFSWEKLMVSGKKYPVCWVGEVVALVAQRQVRLVSMALWAKEVLPCVRTMKSYSSPHLPAFIPVFFPLLCSSLQQGKPLLCLHQLSAAPQVKRGQSGVYGAERFWHREIWGEMNMPQSGPDEGL